MANNGKICVSIYESDEKKFLAAASDAILLADVVELRFDSLENPFSGNLSSNFTSLRESFGGKFLVTFRPREQGGIKSLTMKQRREFWKHIAMQNFADWADFEFDLDLNAADFTFEKVIGSFHDFEGNQIDIANKFEILSKRFDTIKIAKTYDDATAAIEIWKLLERATDNKKVIPIAMGEAGKWTRILALAHGAPLTYSSLVEGSETAPGQISVSDMTEVYRVKELTRDTDVYGIIGSPISHSLSPYIHNRAFASAKRDAVYVPFEVKNLAAFFRRMVLRESREVELNLRGFSVTAPHKISIVEFLDEVDESARAIGAVNTIKIENEKRFGYNTDAKGFIAPLKKVFGDLRDARVAIIGAGGAARGCAYALKHEGVIVSVFARKYDAARRLANEFGVESEEFAFGKTRLENCDVIVNATPLGTRGEHENASPVSTEQLKNVKLVYDLVYSPAKTKLLRNAEIAGAKTISGIDMLIAQAIEQQKIWTGNEPNAREIRRVVEAMLLP